jgi:hypothetical protein
MSNQSNIKENSEMLLEKRARTEQANQEKKTETEGAKKRANQVYAIDQAAANYAKENGLDPARDRSLIFQALRANRPELFV